MKKTVTLIGPLKAYPTVEAVQSFIPHNASREQRYAITSEMRDPLSVYLVDRTLNTMAATANTHIGQVHLTNLINEEDIDVIINRPTKAMPMEVYLVANDWVRCGGSVS